MVVTDCQPTAVPAAAPRPPHCDFAMSLKPYYSTTSNWVKLLSVPESPSPGLYGTAAVQV
eukprot:1272746-Prymnesium_polylepis.1